jgi:hypothetical protein
MVTPDLKFRRVENKGPKSATANKMRQARNLLQQLFAAFSRQLSAFNSSKPGRCRMLRQ